MSTATGRLNWPFAATWAACTFIGWLVALCVVPSGSPVDYYLLAGISAQLMTVGLRWRLIVKRDQPNNCSRDRSTATGWQLAIDASDHEVTWILCWISQLNMLGIVLLGPGLVAATGLLLALVVNELLLLRRGPSSWNEALPIWWPAELRPTGHSPESLPFEAALDRLLQERLDAQFANPDADSSAEFEDSEEEDAGLETDFESEKLSATFHGLTEDGQHYVQGWQRYEMAAGQKNASLTIGFFPPFLTVPDCELDHEGDESLQYEIEHITPAGARVLLKRRQADACAVGKLLWHSSAADKTAGTPR